MSTAFEPGAQPPDGVIPLSVPEMRDNEWAYVKECLDTNWVSSAGRFVDWFEDLIASYTGAKHAVATASGTAALHVALLVAGIVPEDEVLVSSLTFIAPANAIRYVGAWPVFVDSEATYWQMDQERVVDFLDNGCVWRNGALYNKATGRRVTAILPVHILGHPCDMQPLLEVAQKYGLKVIEDATESLGAKYDGQMAGHIGDVGCFSFNGNKLITTGGGGMVVTDNEEWARRAKYLTTQAKDDSVEYIHNEIGYNYRLTNIQAALGCAQMEHLDSYIEAKQRTAISYAEAIGGIPGISTMKEASRAKAVFWLYTVLVDKRDYGMDSRALLAYLDTQGIQTRPLWQPIHLSKAHKGSFAMNCPVAEKIAEDALSLPSSVGLSPQEQERVISGLISARTASADSVPN